MDMAFAKAKSGLYVPSPGGLPGFQRQRMDQTKKSGRSVATFIGFTQFDDVANTDTLISFAQPSGGVQAGDVAFLYGSGNTLSNPAASGFFSLIDNSVSGGFSSASLWYKFLTAADVAAGTWSISSSGAGTRTGGNVAVYRPPGGAVLNAPTIIQKTTFTTSANPVRSMTPFTPAATAWLDLSLILDDTGLSGLETAPNLWTQRFQNHRKGSVSTSSSVADASSSWGAGQAIDWTVNNPGNAQYVWVMEFA